MAYGAGNRKVDGRKLTVDETARPGWCPGAEASLAAGDRVYCTEGLAEVVRVLGKTGDGSRLHELRLPDVKAKPFFAAASNVLAEPAA